VFPVYVPALRERGDDIVLLFQHFAERCARPGVEPIRAASDLSAWLLSHDWPGNCRELLNFVERLSVLWPSKEITLKDIPGAMLPKATRAGINTVDERSAVLALGDWNDDWAEDMLSAAEAEEARAEAALTIDRPSLTAPQVKTPTAKLLPAEGVDLKQILADYEAAWIREAMQKASGNITHAAELLGMRRTTFLERLRKYDPSESRQ
jgi:sigma-54 specific flagellar transcriptional regulator A